MVFLLIFLSINILKIFPFLLISQHICQAIQTTHEISEGTSIVFSDLKNAVIVFKVNLNSSVLFKV